MVNGRLKLCWFSRRRNKRNNLAHPVQVIAYTRAHGGGTVLGCCALLRCSAGFDSESNALAFPEAAPCP